MKRISIKDFEKRVEDRLSNPQEYYDKTLLLWDEYETTDSIPYRVIKQSCIEYNQNNLNDQTWMGISDMSFNTDDYTTLQVCCLDKRMFGLKNRGILFNTGRFFFEKKELDEWIAFVNTHKNPKGHLSKDWVLIACAHAKDYGLTENLFGTNCEIVSIRPSLAEWVQWASQWYDKKSLDIVADFIKKNGQTVDFFYWGRIIDQIEGYVKLHKYKRLKEIPEDDFRLYVGGVTAGLNFPKKEFYDFIQSYS